MNDLISRQAVIDIIEFECGEWIGLAKTIVKAIEQLPSTEKTDSILEDIKSEIEKEIISEDSIDYINGLNMALMIINEKHISRTAEWITVSKDEVYECSNCRYKILIHHNIKPYKFCPNCGARMKEEKE